MESDGWSILVFGQHAQAAHRLRAPPAQAGTVKAGAHAAGDFTDRTRDEEITNRRRR
jgi:hypothetical protein